MLNEIKAQITELPTYGYRRACALVNRHRANTGAPRVNAKRTYRVMAAHALLLPKAPRRRQSSRPHEGKVAVVHSDMSWCSDGFEIKCDSGQTVTATFTKDCCDREILAYRAWEGKGLPGEPVREMLIEAVEKRFGGVEGVPSTHALEFLSDKRGRLHRGRDSTDRSTTGPEPGQHARVQSPEQRHGRELREHVQARLRQPHGPCRCENGNGADGRSLRALQ